MRYARLIAHYPYVIVVSILCLAVLCLVLCLTVVELPNFQDPKAGFEPRGTEIANKIVAYNNLVQNLDGKLSLSPAGQKWGFEGAIQYSTENQTQVPHLGEQSMGQPVKRSIDESSSPHFQDSFFL